MADKVKILMIDDEQDFIVTMSFWLKSKGYDVSGANDGKEGLEKLKAEKPDVIFLDLNMPVMDGQETLIKIREFNKTVPVIVISAYVDSQDKLRQMREQGISGVFYKGRDFNESAALIETTLRMHRQIQNKVEE